MLPCGVSSLIAGALTSSPSWLFWGPYWLLRGFGVALRWWFTTATKNAEAVATGASIVYWLAVWYSFSAGCWGWKKTRGAYGIREAVDFGENADRLGTRTKNIIQWQTRTRVKFSAMTLLYGFSACACLLVLGVLGAWTLPALLAYMVARVRREQRGRKWAT